MDIPKRPYRPGYCEVCGDIDSTTELRINPYKHELYDDISEELICNQCFESLKEDI